MDRRSLRRRQGRPLLIQRISLGNTRAIINAIHDGSLVNADYETLPIFNLSYPTSIPGVDTKILNPKQSWANK
jgi:phosphoenolpyruvate carboxykinase (ATP)